MSNNLHRVQQIFIADGTALPTNNAPLSAMTVGKIGVYGQDMLALDPVGTDNITTQPFIYIMESKSDATTGVSYIKRTGRIDGSSIINYTAKKYEAPKRSVESFGYHRAFIDATGTVVPAGGSIEVNPSTDYQFSIIFKNDKHLYSERPEAYRVSFTSSATATQLTIATQAAAAINNGGYKGQIKAVVIGDGIGIFGLTGATNFGVETWSLDVPQYSSTTYTGNQVYFSLHIDDSTGFGGTTYTSIQSFDLGSGTYAQVANIENYDLMYEGLNNRRQWPIPSVDMSANAAFITSLPIVPTATGALNDDFVTFSGSVIGILAGGDKVSIAGVLYEIKYLVSNTTAVLTTPLVALVAAGAVLVRVKYDIINIEYNDSINTPTGVVAIANKSVVIAVPAITAGGLYTSQSQSGTDVKAILDAWMLSTPRAFAAITI